MNGYIRHAGCRNFETPGVTIKGMGCELCNNYKYIYSGQLNAVHGDIYTPVLECRGNLPQTVAKNYSVDVAIDYIVYISI